MDSAVKNSGEVLIEFLDAAGNLIDVQHVKNLIVNAGLDHIASRFSDPSPPPAMSHIAIGRDPRAQVSTDTALFSELSRVAAKVTRDQWITTFTASFPALSFSIAEMGIFNSASGGTMLSRVAFAAQALNASTITVTWNIIQSP